MQSMQPVTPLQLTKPLSPSAPGLPQSQPAPSLQEKMAQTPSQLRPRPQPRPQLRPRPQHEPKPTEQVQTEPLQRRVPRLRAVVESQAFKNILVDEMDMMFSRAATLIQANWRGYQLRQKLVSQMMAAKAIQEAWRRFSTRRLLRSSKLGVKKVSKDEGDIPYHPPQQVRFKHPEDHTAVGLPVMVTKETQFPSRDNLASSQPPVTPGGMEPGLQIPCGYEGSGVVFLSPQTVATRLPCPMSQGPKQQPCLMTKTVRSTCRIRHLEGDTGMSKHVTSRVTKAGSPESAASSRYGLASPGPLKTQTQARIEADVIKASPQACLVTKTPPKMYPAAISPKSPAPMSSEPKAAPQACPPSITTVMKDLPQTCTVHPMSTRPPAHVCPASLFSSTTPQVRPAGTVARGGPQGSLLASSIKASPRPAAPMSKSTLQTGTGPGLTKTSPQTCPVPINQSKMCSTTTSSKTSSQASKVPKPSPQMRLAAMITKTPAQIRSVAAVLRTFRLVPPAVTSFKAPCPNPVAHVSHTSSQAHLSATKAKVTVNAKPSSGLGKISQSYLAEGRNRCAPQPHLDLGVPYPPRKTALEAEKTKTDPPKLSIKETAPKTHRAMGMTRALSWTRVVEDRNKAPGQTHQQVEVVKVQSKGYMPVGTPVTLSAAQMAAPLTKASSNVQTPTRPARVQSHLATHLSRTLALSHPPSVVSGGLGHLAMCPPSTVPQPQVATCVMKGLSQFHPPAEQSSVPSHACQATCSKKATPQGCPPTKVNKAPSLAHLITCLTKVPPQGHVPIGLTKAHSQAQLVTEKAKCFFKASVPADLSSKTQSQPLLTSSKASVQFWQHFGSLDSGSQAKPEDRGTAQLQLHSQSPARPTQSPRPVSVGTQSMLVPLLTSAGHPTCNTESWGDSMPSQTASPPPPMANQTMSCQDDVAISQIASLCAEVLAALSSQEDLRALLAKALSQGEVRAAVSQALSREVLGATVKTLPQSMLGMALMKALSWGELGVTLSRALSRGELRTDLAKSMQGRLAEVLCKALSGEERAALSQALCQGELGAVFSQSLSQVAQRTSAILPNATSKKAAAASSVPMASLPVEVNCRGHLAVEWRPALGSSKVRPPWEGFAMGLCAGVLQGAGDGVTWEGSPCWPRSPMSTLWPRGLLTSPDQRPFLTSLDSILPWELGRVVCSDPCPTPRLCKPAIRDKGPHLPKPTPWQSLPTLVQPLVANGAGPSTCQPSVSNSTVPSSRQPPVASRVSSRPWTSSRGGTVGSSLSGKFPGSVGGGQPPVSQRPSFTCRGNVCQCQNSGIFGVSSCQCPFSVARRPSQLPKATEEKGQRTLSLSHKQAHPGARERTCRVSPIPPKATVSRQVEQGREDGGPLPVSPKLGTQVHPSMSSPRQERNPARASANTLSRSSEPAGRHHVSLLNELLATLPQHPRNVLTKSFPCGSSARDNDSQSSQRSDSSASFSTVSLASMGISEVLEDPQEASVHEDHHLESLPSREVDGRSPGPAHMDNMGQSSFRHAAPHVQKQPLEFSSILCHLNIHWDPESGSDHSSHDLTKRPSQDLVPSSHPSTMDQQPVERSHQDPTFSQPMLANGRTAKPIQPSEASTKSLPLSQPLETMQLSTSPPQLSVNSTLSPSVTQQSAVIRASPSLTHPSVVSGVPPDLTQPSNISGDSPSLTPPSVVSGVPPGLIQPSMVIGVPLRLTQPSAVTKVFPSLVQPSVDTTVPPSLDQSFMYIGGSPYLGQPLMYNVGPPNFAQPFIYHRGSSNYTQPPSTNRVATSQHSVNPGLAPSLVQPPGTIPLLLIGTRRETPLSASPSIAAVGDSQPGRTAVAGATMISAHRSGGHWLEPMKSQLYQTTGVPPGLGQPSLVTGVPLGPCQITLASGVSPKLGQPSLATGAPPGPCKTSLATGVSPGPCKTPLATGAPPGPCKTSLATGVSPGPGQTPLATWVPPGPCKTPLATGVPPGPGKTPLATGMPPDPCQTPLATGVSPGSGHTPLATGVPPGPCNTPLATGVPPDPCKTPLATGVSPGPCKTPLATGVSPSLGQTPLATGVPPGPCKTPLATGVPPGPCKTPLATGVSPGSGQTPLATGAPPVPCKTPLATGVSPSLGQTPLATGVPPGPCQTPLATGVSPGSGQTPLATGVPPRPCKTPLATGVSPGPCQTPLATGVSSGLGQPSLASGVSPSLTQKSMATKVSPLFFQPFTSFGVPTNFARPSMSHEASSNLVRPSVVTVMSPNLVRASMAPVLSQPSVTRGVAPSLVPSFLSPGLYSQLCQPSANPLGSLNLFSPAVVYGVGHSVNQQALGSQVGSLQDPHTDDVGATQCPPSSLSSGGSCPPETSKVDQSCLNTQGGPVDDALMVASNGSAPQGSLGLPEPSPVSRRSPGPLAGPHPTFYQVSVDPEKTPGASVPCQTWFKGIAMGTAQGPVAAGMFLSVCQGQAPSSLAGGTPCRNVDTSMIQSPSQGANGLSPSASWGVKAGGPRPHTQASMVTGTAQSLCPPAVPSMLGGGPCEFFLSQMSPAVPPQPQPHSVATIVPSNHPYAGMVPGVGAVGGGSFAPGSIDSRVSLAMTSKPGTGSAALGVPGGSVIRGVEQNLPLGPVAGETAQRMVNGMAQTHSPESMVDGKAQSLAPNYAQMPDHSRKKPGPALGPMASSKTSVTPVSLARGAGPSVPLGSAEGSVAPGSMLVGISPRPYPRGKTREASLFPGFPRAMKPGSAVQNLPLVLNRALQASRDPRMATLGVPDQQASLRPGQTDDTKPLGSIKPEVLSFTSWRNDNLQETDKDPENGRLMTENFSNKGQMSLLRKEAPGQAGGIAPVPLWALSSGSRSIADDTTPVLPSLSASSRVPSGSHPAHGVPSAQERSIDDRTVTQALDPGVTERPLDPFPESIAHAKPQTYLLGTVASEGVPVPPQLVPGRAASPGNNPSLPLSSGTTGAGTHIQPPVSLTQNLVSSHSQVETAPSSSQKPSHKSLTRKKSHRSVHGSIVSELLEGLMGSLMPSYNAPRQLSLASVDSHKQSTPGAPPAASITPIIRSGDRRERRLSMGVRKVSLGYESSPSGSRRLLHNQSSTNTLHTVQHGTLTVPQGQNAHHAAISETGSAKVPPNPNLSQSWDPYYIKGPETGCDRGSPKPTIPQGPADTMAGCQLWNSAPPSLAVKPTDCRETLRTWRESKVPGPWSPVGNVAALDCKPSGELLVSVKAMNSIMGQAVVTIQACTRGYLVRQTIKVWHQWATIIQATWRGYRVRRNLARLFRATMAIQAAWRGYCARREQACHVLLPKTWPEAGRRAMKTSKPHSCQGVAGRPGSHHRCFLSCQRVPVCSVCQALSPRPEGTPSVMMLMGTAPRTCHVCGHTLSTRIVQGMGQAPSGQTGSPQQAFLCPQNQAATTIQSAWRGFRTRRELSRQQSAAKMLQATWRGHYTRICLTTDALLGLGGPWDRSRDASRRSSSSQFMHWPDV